MREKIFLAALLHDIGKFYQRADPNKLTDKFSEDRDLENVASMVCPENEYGLFGYQHAAWTYLFFREFENIFNEIKGKDGQSLFRVNPFNKEDQTDNLINLSIFHHRPATKLQGMVQMADWISSGMERNKENLEKEDSSAIGKYAYKKRPLRNIFDLIQSTTGIQNSGQTVYPLIPMSVERNNFPDLLDEKKLSAVGFKEASSLYSFLWTHFLNDFKQIPAQGYQNFTDSLLHILKKHSWSIPASTQDLQHVSLYEHLRTTAAIAVSLYDYSIENETAFNWNGHRLVRNEGHLPLLLSCWDLSGIQKFIYNISGRKAAVSLKGRSFYLQLLIQGLMQEICDSCQLSEANVIYNSGGKMFLLMANTQKNREALNSIHTKYEKAILAEHGQSLYLCHGITAFGYDFRGVPKPIVFNTSGDDSGDLSELWKRTIEAASANKSHKYLQLINSDFDRFFKPTGSWGNHYNVCAVTGEVGIEKSSLHKLKTGSSEEDVWVRPSVLMQIDLGNDLKDAEYLLSWIMADEHEEHPQLKYKKELRAYHLKGTGVRHYLISEADLRSELITSTDDIKIKALNATNSEQLFKIKGNNLTYGYMFYGGNEQAQRTTKHGAENKTFEELSDGELLGVLRMDVDGLGLIFQKGIPQNQRSFASYAMLSNRLDWFFSGYINWLRNSEEFEDYVNILYSGGDDVFAVGRWDKLIDFADKLRDEFRKYAGGREDVSISAGLSLVGSKFPIRKAAELAGEAEQAGKNYQYERAGNRFQKNAITLFDITVNWAEEWKEVKHLKEELFRLVSDSNHPLSKGFLHKLMQWNVRREAYLSNDKSASLSFKWDTAYYISRYLGRTKNKDVQNRQFLEDLSKCLLTGESMDKKIKFGDNYYRLTAMAARWVELLTKNK